MPRRRPPPPRGDALYPTLDLHGHTAEDALRIATGWLREQQGREERVVVLITGRGLRSKGGPVLRGEIEHLLDGLRGSLVADATLDAAGGAFRVELLPLPVRRPAASAAAPRRLDPELRRLAEESLSELGISATPALVEAEVRRLLRERERDS